MPKRKDLEKPANNCPLNVNPSQSPSVPPVKNGRDSRRKLRGASLLSDHAWLEISRTLGLTKREVANCPERLRQSPGDRDCEATSAYSGHTVHTHLNRLFKKLTVTSRTELVLRIMEQMIGLTLSETRDLPPICRRHHTGGCCLHNSPGKPRQAVKRNFRCINPLGVVCRPNSRLFKIRQSAKIPKPEKAVPKKS